jgi:decaprenylphospho-beta-D-erythro-pentofuranosid-2-ulose 2-reductase
MPEYRSVPSATPLMPYRRAIIIGASSGIGEALARRLAQEGFTLALLARRGEMLEAVCDEIQQILGERRAIPYVCDVREYEKIPDLLRQIVAELGGLDLVVYAAGVNYPPGIENYDFEHDRQMIEINLLGAMAWFSQVAPLFQSMRGGQMVAISSVAGERGRVGNPGYNTSKAGLTCYMEALRNRLTRHGVHVLTVKPGFVKTQMLAAAQQVLFPISTDQAAADICKAIHQRRQEIYTPTRWRLIMWLIRNIPSLLFRRMSI